MLQVVARLVFEVESRVSPHGHLRVVVPRIQQANAQAGEVADITRYQHQIVLECSSRE